MTWPCASASSCDQLELAPRQVDAHAAHEGLELVRPDLDLADHERPGVDARLGALAPPHDGLDARDQLLGMARLGHPVVGAQPQPAHALGDGGLARADDHAEARAAACRASRGSSSPAGRARRGRSRRAFSRIATIASSGTGLASTRYCQPAPSSRLERTCRNPVSESSTAMRTGGGLASSRPGGYDRAPPGRRTGHSLVTR